MHRGRALQKQRQVRRGLHQEHLHVVLGRDDPLALRVQIQYGEIGCVRT
jgi:hypothetical protein